jgi:hypothetical protein
MGGAVGGGGGGGSLFALTSSFSLLLLPVFGKTKAKLQVCLLWEYLGIDQMAKEASSSSSSPAPSTYSSASLKRYIFLGQRKSLPVLFLLWCRLTT